MPFALIVIGAVMVIAAVKNTQGNLGQLVKGEFVGQNNFIFWLSAMFLIGAIGYIPKAKPIATGLLGLVIVVLFLTKGNTTNVGGGFFAQLTKGLQSTTTAANASQPVAASSQGFSLPNLASLATHLIQ